MEFEKSSHPDVVLESIEINLDVVPSDTEESVTETDEPIATEIPIPTCVEADPCESDPLPGDDDATTFVPHEGQIPVIIDYSRPDEPTSYEGSDDDEPEAMEPLASPEQVKEASARSNVGDNLVLALRGNERDPWPDMSVLDLINGLATKVEEFSKEVFGSADLETQSVVTQSPVHVEQLETQEPAPLIPVLVSDPAEVPVEKQLAQPVLTKVVSPSPALDHPYKNVSEPTAPTPQVAMATLVLIVLSLITGVIFTIGTSFTSRKN
ncbi:hypothetical protein [Corynebacterium kalinowskii]|uniref:hypothetical protein n=1 Tax=Corynebacterium kalinowskii TaxID=2675216 RepID=UPI0012E2000C|nr:hypothetical protein [Corynebacterium kalinowskii]